MRFYSLKLDLALFAFMLKMSLLFMCLDFSRCVSYNEQLDSLVFFILSLQVPSK